ncbi:hypothetical protein RIF29_14149 [Crotalaria pallida]|uniref:Transmembrane protein n=1 Tax=Crotalaria pallida TaxID=3830 RepID=A0AAN9FGZ6_CROPI
MRNVLRVLPKIQKIILHSRTNHVLSSFFSTTQSSFFFFEDSHHAAATPPPQPRHCFLFFAFRCALGFIVFLGSSLLCLFGFIAC